MKKIIMCISILFIFLITFNRLSAESAIYNLDENEDFVINLHLDSNRLPDSERFTFELFNCNEDKFIRKEIKTVKDKKIIKKDNEYIYQVTISKEEMSIIKPNEYFIRVELLYLIDENDKEYDILKNDFEYFIEMNNFFNGELYDNDIRFVIPRDIIRDYENRFFLGTIDDRKIYEIYNDVFYKEIIGSFDFGFNCGENCKYYWYENGNIQGTYEDSKCVYGDGTCRGREIYDPETDAWYWLDSIYGGAKAINKEVWMPYIYQDELKWNDKERSTNAHSYALGSNGYQLYKTSPICDMSKQVEDAIKEKSGKWVRYNSEGKMIKGWYTASGELDEKLYPDQKGNVYYYDQKTGLMAKGLYVIDGYEYYFNETTGALERVSKKFINRKISHCPINSEDIYVCVDFNKFYH